jgi:hypothetical protein
LDFGLQSKTQSKIQNPTNNLLERMKNSIFAACLLIAFPMLALAERPAPDWVLVTEKAPWRARDSQGEVAYGGRLWILGGWFDSFVPAPRDVWSSTDGKTWKLVTPEAPFKHSDLGMSLVFGDRMWFLGGWYNGRGQRRLVQCRRRKLGASHAGRRLESAAVRRGRRLQRPHVGLRRLGELLLRQREEPEE